MGSMLKYSKKKKKKKRKRKETTSEERLSYLLRFFLPLWKDKSNCKSEHYRHYMSHAVNVRMCTQHTQTAGCDSGSRAGHLVIGGGRMWLESPAPPAACWSVLEQDSEPQIAPGEQLAHCMPLVCECVCEWVNVTSVVKRLERSVDWKSTLEMQDRSPDQLIQMCTCKDSNMSSFKFSPSPYSSLSRPLRSFWPSWCLNSGVKIQRKLVVSKRPRWPTTLYGL